MLHAFDASKRESLQKLQDAIDKSPKGSIDAPIVDMIEAVNGHPNYVRYLQQLLGPHRCFCGVAEDGADHLITKGGKWLVSSHAPVSYDELHAAVLADPSQLNGMVIFKHEPFIMHVQCRDEEAAKAMLQCGLACGFRESGVVLGNKRTMVAIRTTANSMEIPIALNGKLMVDDEYLRWILAIANEKFKANVCKTQRFMAELSTSLFAPPRTQLVAISATRAAIEVPRAGHTSVLHKGRVYLLGGQGATATGTSRLSDVVVIDAATKAILQTCDVAPMTARMHHSAVVHNGAMLVFGGRASPAKALNELCSLNLTTLECTTVAATGAVPSPRYGHAAVLVGNRMVVLGGRDATGVLHDVFVLDLGVTPPAWQARRSGPSMFQHAAVAVGQQVYCFGGRATPDALDEIPLQTLHVYDIIDDTWRTQATTGKVLPCARASLQAVNVQDQHIVLTGGSSSLMTCQRDVFSLHLDRMSWRQHEPLDDGAVLSSHSMVYDETTASCLVTGGSCQCFGFGSVYSPVYVLDLELQVHVEASTTNASSATTAPASKTLVIVVEKALVKTVKTRLEALSLYDKSRRITPVVNGPVDGACMVPVYDAIQHLGPDDEILDKHLAYVVPEAAAANCVIPITNAAPIRVKKTPTAPSDAKPTATPSKKKNKHKKAAAAPSTDVPVAVVAAEAHGVLVLKDHVKAIKTQLEALCLYDKSRRIHPSNEDPNVFVVPVVVAELPSSLAHLPVVVDAEKARKPVLNPNVLIHSLLQAHAAAHGLGAAPAKFEFIADILVLPKNTCMEPAWTDQTLWLAVADAVPTIRRVARNADIDPNDRRQSRVSLLFVHPALAPSPNGQGWVEVRENGLTYGWDIEKVMFSSGNVTEKARMARIGCANEVIVDLYAGIGYYVVPFLVHGKAAYVHALEWNPDSVACLKHNLARNGVSDRCSVYLGDNRLTGPTLGAIADRVNLGLLPSSELGWPVAVQVLKAGGGMLHVHENVAVDHMDAWKQHVLTSIESLAAAIGKHWTVELLHFERVKSYAPKVFHIVADIRCATPSL
ncbi:hypothetical protein SPRG_10645 [Saprolegnia parasitica CBS 223.65]|uniref:SAM-dependent methyltransferase TRM5/TYW2-type domain-containing protein n=1 Tax=Saprolegnia parasitica (strain CBS 223.65) TaxID=695850 RepID=A0A067BZH7_SAPPC|nr:hypothetical protein SPRG_10645 [Saprolegnia parasitica CBS 223.65]KDO23949.1 hypothetical protein SPRG_10645 [Saprolegnia parasitica CBS 223.65]|eukprot:XP_012205271.1 hypothetical protein SPRG_10645 [Saprolegnia parasitica CBS 223.65]